MEQFINDRNRGGQETQGCRAFPAGQDSAAAQTYLSALAHFLASAYDFSVKDISPAKRGFYGETWNIKTEAAAYFLKIDRWEHHEKSYQNSLPVMRYMTRQGISFIPTVIAAKGGQLHSRFQQDTAAVFSYIPGELSEDYSTAQLYRRLAKIYQLGTSGLDLEKEDFGAGRVDAFLTLQSRPELPAEVKRALVEKGPIISRYGERLKKFSSICKGSREDFHITHGDAGGNCILYENQLFLVDWDSVLLAPIERDAWIFICDGRELQTIRSVLAENGIDYIPDQNRLCYYSYDFFFYYLNEYLQSIIHAKSGGLRTKIAKELTGHYLADCWIYQRLEAADAVG